MREIELDFLPYGEWVIIGFIVVIFLVLIGAIVYEDRMKKRYHERLSQSGIYDVDRMEGIEFEQYLTVLFKNLGIKAQRNQASNDFGADLILEGKERIVVQAKRYSKKVGIKAVQEINSARNYYRAHEAWVITNNYFTSSAIKLAESTEAN